MSTPAAVDLERYTPADDEWTWQRRVVNNGEEVTLTEVGDGISVLKGMQEHNWYVVAYNAKGNVISASHAVDELASKTTTQHEDDINSLPATINAPGVNTVLYEKSEYNGYTTPSTCPDNSGASHTANEHKNSYGPKLVANTFYDITTATTGFYVADDVKVVFIQKNKNVTETHFLSGKTDLENAIEDLITTDTDNCGKIYHYEVSAVLENGIAKTVILHDLHVQGDGGSHVTPPQDYNPIVTQNGLVLEVKANTNDGQSILVFSAVQDWLSDNGYELVSIAKNASSGYDVVAKKGGSTFMFATSLTKMSKITVNGAVGYYAEGATITATNYILGATEAAVAPGVVVATPTTGSVTVAYTTHNGKFIRTDVKQFSVDSTANMCYRVGDMITGLTGNWYTADSGATYQPVTSAGVEVTATLGTTITSGYYKVTQKVASPGPDKVAYVTAGSTTTGLTLAGPWAKDTTGTMHKVTTNQINMLAAANARDITIANGEDAYAEVKLTSNAAATAVDGITAVVTPAPDAPQYAKAGQTVTFTVTLTGTAADASDAAVTVTLANAKWQATITGITGVTRTSDTVVTIADDTDLGTGITLEVTADVATTPADIAATLTVA